MLYGKHEKAAVEFEAHNAALKEHWWMAPADSCSYEYCLVVNLYTALFSFLINCPFPGGSDFISLVLATPP